MQQELAKGAMDAKKFLVGEITFLASGARNDPSTNEPLSPTQISSESPRLLLLLFTYLLILPQHVTRSTTIVAGPIFLDLYIPTVLP